jgi:hypothetical protein
MAYTPFITHGPHRKRKNWRGHTDRTLSHEPSYIFFFQNKESCVKIKIVFRNELRVDQIMDSRYSDNEISGPVLDEKSLDKLNDC